MDKKIIAVSYKDYNNGDDDENWFYEYSPAGFLKAKEKVMSLVNKWYEDEDLSWNTEETNINFECLHKRGCFYLSNEDWLYFYIEKKTMWVNSKMDIE